MDFGNAKLNQKCGTMNPNPEPRAGYFSRLFFLWLVPLLRKGAKQTLSADDVYDVLDEHEAGHLADQLGR